MRGTRMAYGNRWLVSFFLFTRIPPGRGSGEKEFEPVEVSEELLFSVGQRTGKSQYGRRR